MTISQVHSQICDIFTLMKGNIQNLLFVHIYIYLSPLGIIAHEFVFMIVIDLID